MYIRYFLSFDRKNKCGIARYPLLFLDRMNNSSGARTTARKKEKSNKKRNEIRLKKTVESLSSKKRPPGGGREETVKSCVSCGHPRLSPFASTGHAPDKVSVPKDISPALCRSRQSLAAAKCPTAAEPGQHGLNLVDTQRGAVMIGGDPTAEIHLIGMQQGVAQFMHVDLAAVVVVERGEGGQQF